MNFGGVSLVIGRDPNLHTSLVSNLPRSDDLIERNQEMPDHEMSMQVYVQLAVISEQKRQSLVRDRFLLLASVEACRAGWPDVAACCRKKLIESNPAHQASRYPTIADALRDTDFQQLIAVRERYCPFEKAEALLNQACPSLNQPSDLTIGEQMLKLLNPQE